MDGGPDNTETNPGEVVVGRRSSRPWAPWLASLAVHAALVAAAMALTWTVAALRDEPPAPVIVADFSSATYAPLAALQSTPLETPADAPPAEAAVPDVPAPSLAPAELPALDLVEPADIGDLAPVAPAVAGPPPVAVPLGAEFVGLSTSNARRLVYVIDASGSMIRTLPIVLDELARSLERLDPVQSFAVFFFQQDRAVAVPPRRLVDAGPDAIDRALVWMRGNVVPEGRSNPLAALGAAIELKPDVIFLLSENITGAGEFEIDADELLRRLDRLNPVESRSGRRRVRINCVQFLEADPMRTLERIAAEHGGADGYKLLDRAELGLEGP